MTPQEIKQVQEQTLAYTANLLRGWINGDATVEIPDKQYDMFRQWIQLAKTTPRAATQTPNEDTEKYKTCLEKIRKYSTSEAVQSWISEVLPKV